MKSVLLTPGVRSIPQSINLDSGDQVLITNPVVQKQLLQNSKNITLISEESLLQETEFTELNATAKKWAQTWYLIPELAAVLNCEGINRGSILTRGLSYEFLTLLRSALVASEYFTRFSISTLHLVDDGGSWSKTTQIIAEQHQIQIIKTIIQSDLKPKGDRFKRLLKNVLGTISSLLYQIKTKQSGGIVFSSALTFAVPFLRHTPNHYYLRDIFSWAAWKLSHQFSFSPILPNFFQNHAAHPLESTSTVAETVRHYFQNHSFFTYKGIDFTAVVEPVVSAQLTRSLENNTRLIYSFSKMLQQLRPSAVMVDEEVCPFNKILILSAKKANVPTYTLMHGVPFFDIGTLPSQADHILTWGQSSRQRLEEWGISSEKMIEVGAPQYANFKSLNPESARAQVLTDLGIPVNSKLLLFPSQPFHTNEHPDFFGSPLTPDLIRSFLRVVIECLRQDAEAIAIFKFHPGEKHENFSKSFAQENGADIFSRIRFIRIYSTPRLLAAADLIITIGSTVYFEALLLNKPILMLDDPNYRYFEFMRPQGLNVHDSQNSSKIILQSLMPSAASSLLELQEKEKNLHFYEKNRSPIENIFEAIATPDKVNLKNTVRT